MIDIQFDPISKNFTHISDDIRPVDMVHISASLITGLCMHVNRISGRQAAEDLRGEFCAFLGKTLDQNLEEAQNNDPR